MKEFCISPNDANGRMDKFCMRILKDAPSSFVYKMIRKKNITLNGGRAQGNEILHAGDVIRFFLSDETFEKFSAHASSEQASGTGNVADTDSLQIVYEDTDVLIVNKPSGILSQKAGASDLSMNEICLHYLKEKGEWDPDDPLAYRPSVCNRLDRNTSGLLLFAKTLPCARVLSASLRDRTIRKYYVCIVKGDVKESADLDGFAIKDEKRNTVRLTKVQEPGAAPVKTHFEPVKGNGELTLLKVELITGKTHQIRLHLASIGHPILGDPKYGDRALNKKYHVATQLLHAYRMEMPEWENALPGISGKVFEIPYPERFQQIMR